MADVFEQIERAMHAAMDAGRVAVANDNEGLADTSEFLWSDERAGAVSEAGPTTRGRNGGCLAPRKPGAGTWEPGGRGTAGTLIEAGAPADIVLLRTTPARRPHSPAGLTATRRRRLRAGSEVRQAGG